MNCMMGRIGELLDGSDVEGIFFWCGVFGLEFLDFVVCWGVLFNVSIFFRDFVFLGVGLVVMLFFVFFGGWILFFFFLMGIVWFFRFLVWFKEIGNVFLILFLGIIEFFFILIFFGNGV